MEPSETIEYRDYTIEVFADHDAMNPFSEYDGEPPICVYAGRRDVTEYGLTLDCPELSREELARGAAVYLPMLGYPATWLGLMAFARDVDNSGPLHEAMADAIAEQLDGEHTSDRMEYLAELYQLKGIAAYTGTVFGCSQGDWARVLAVALPEWVSRTGAPADTHARQLADAVALFGWWAFGECYGWQALNPDGDVLESVWGYYGPDHEESGLMDAARSAVDADLPAWEARKREEAAEAALADEYRAAAQALASDELQIDPDAAVSFADNGAWVSAWVWIEGGEGAA